MSLTLRFPLCENLLVIAKVPLVAPLLSGEVGCRGKMIAVEYLLHVLLARKSGSEACADDDAMNMTPLHTLILP